MSNNQDNRQTAMATRLESSLDKGVAGGIAVSPSRGLIIESTAQMMEFAKLMAISKEAVPKHLRENPGACLAVCIQAYDWKINPFALANKSYLVNDRIAYEAQIYHAILLQRAPISGRIRKEYTGEGQNRRLKVWAKLSDGSGETVFYQSPKIGDIKVQNSPLWKTDPDQQLFYFAVRSFARSEFPDVMMGIVTVDEMQDSVEITQQRSEPISLQSLIAPRIAEQVKDAVEPVTQAGEADLPTTQDYLDRISGALNAMAVDKTWAAIQLDHASNPFHDGDLERLKAACEQKKSSL